MGEVRLLVLVFLGLLCVHLASAEFACVFKTSCNATETSVLKVQNDSGGYNNAHAQLINYTALNYTYRLCCEADSDQWLNNSCQNENSTQVISLYSQTNSHVQVPSVGSYDYDVCLALSPGNLTCEYVNSSCSTNYVPLFSIAGSPLSDNTTNAHIANYSHYTLNVCCSQNQPPSIPVLLVPSDNNLTVFDRNVSFDWEDSTDAEGNPITYDINITSATCPTIDQASLSISNYTSTELCVDTLYNWTVRACDEFTCSAYATTFNFTIASTLGLTFTANNTNFGTMIPLQSNDTSDNAPAPFTIENTGNVITNVSIKADDPLFDLEDLGNTSFQLKGREDETGAYVSTITSYINFTTQFQNIFVNFSYQDSQDSAFVDINVTVPLGEPTGVKSSTINITGESVE